MMMVPYMFNDDLMDDLFNDNWERDFDRAIKKEDVKLDLQNGYLTITANRSEDLDEKDNEGRYIRQERCTGSCARSFYVGENLKPTDVAAKFENGILELKLPKADKQIPEKPTTLIEIQ